MIAVLQGLAESIQRFDTPLADSPKLMIEKLQIRLNVQQIVKVDFEASVEQTVAKLRA